MPIIYFSKYTLFLMVFTTAIALLLLTGCGTLGQPTQGSSASLAVAYTNLTDLKHGSDVAVIGTISSIADQHTTGIPYVDFTFAIQQVIYDPHHLLQGSQIIVRQSGTTQPNVSVEDDEGPLFKIGEQAVLFLKNFSPQHYRLAGGITGRFRLQNGMVSNVENIGVKLGGPIAEARFIQMVKNA